MENTSPPTISHKKHKGRQKASIASKSFYNCRKPMIKEFTKEYLLDHIPPNKRKTRRGQTSDHTVNFSTRISKINIPRSSRVLRSATHGAEILSERHPSLVDLQNTDPLRIAFGGDISSSEDSPKKYSQASNQLIIKRGGSEHRSIYRGSSKGDPNFNELLMENNNSTTQPNNNVTAEGHQRESCNELVVEPRQRALIADEETHRIDNSTSVSQDINPEARSENEATQDSDLDHLLSDGSTFFEDYRWLLGLDMNDLAPELPEVSIDDIATLPNLDLDERVPVTEIIPTLFQSDTYGIDSNLAAGSLTSYQVSNSVATRTAAQSIPLHVSSSAISSHLYVNTNFQTVLRSQSFDTTIQNSGELVYSATSGGNIEHISSPIRTSWSSMMDNNPDSPCIKQELDFEPQCRIHLVDTPPSFTRITEKDATPIKKKVFETQKSINTKERSVGYLRDRQQQSVARLQWTRAAEPSETQNLVHLVGPQINTFQDPPSSKPQHKSGPQVNERQNSVHSDGAPMDILQDTSQHYQSQIFQVQPFMRASPVGAATYRPQPTECKDLDHSKELHNATFQSRQQQSFTRPQQTSGALPNERQDVRSSYQAGALRREQPFVLKSLASTTTYRPHANKRQRPVHPDEPPIFRSRQRGSVTRPQSTSRTQANELQKSVHSREPPRRSFSRETHWSTGAKARERQVRKARPQRPSGAQPNERQNYIHLDESPMTTFQGRQQQLLERPQRTSRPLINDTALPCTTTYNPQADERQGLVHSGSPVGRIYPRPFARMPSTVVTPTTPRVVEPQIWHHSYLHHRETHYSWQDNPSSSTIAPLRDMFQAGQNLTSPKQYQQSLMTVRNRSQQMEASGCDISNQQYGSATLNADSNQYLRPHSVSGEIRVRNIPPSSGAPNEIINPEPVRTSRGKQEDFKSFTRAEVSSMMGMHAEQGMDSFPSMLPSHSLPANYANTPQGSVHQSSSDERAPFGSWRDSLNVQSRNLN